MKLFKYEGYQLTIAEEAMLLKPFKAIWKRDKTRNKEIAQQELGYIYFMEDPRSDYLMYTDVAARAQQVKVGLGIDTKWKPDKIVEEAQAFYRSFKSDGAILLDDMREMVAKLRGQLKEIDLTATDERGKLIYSLDSYTKTVADLAKLIKVIDETEKNIARDIIQSDKVRGSLEKSVMEDDDDE